MRTLPLALCALLASACTKPGTTSPGAETPAEATAAEGGAATDFTLRDVEGRSVSLSDFKGQVVLIDFWATWCQPCEAEIPHIQEIYDKNKDKGFTVLAISMDGPETIALVTPFVRKYSLTFPVLLDEETKVVGIYNPKRTAPLTLLIDRGGRIAKVHQSYNPGDEAVMAAEVAKLVEAPASSPK